MPQVDFDEITLAKLAREMAMNIRKRSDIFDDYGIDENDYYQLTKNEYFSRVKEQFSLEWNATTSTEDRLRIGALAYLEQMIPVITRRAMREDTALAGATDVGKLLTKMAGVGEAKSDKANLDRFVITINMGADTEHYDKPLAVVDPVPQIPAVRPEDRIIGEANGKADRKRKAKAAEE